MSEVGKINIDFHSHILPGIDDGAKTPEISKGQLLELKKQGVDKVFLTSHFDFRKETPSEFILKREEAFEKLMQIYDSETMPKVYKGAEIYMSRDMGDMDYTGLELEKIGFVLIEFPREPYGKWMFDVLETLLFERRMNVIIAHVNRVTSEFKKDVLKSLFEFSDLVFQVNAEAFEGILNRDPFKGLSVEGLNFILGTDTHDLDDRAPNFDRALKRLNWRGVTYLKESMERTTAYFDSLLK